MSIVINLGRCTFTNLLNEWLKLKDICVFDSSLCNWSLRNLFQINYAWKKVEIMEQSPILSEGLIDWGFRHKFHITEITLTNYYLTLRRKRSIIENVITLVQNLMAVRISNMVLSRAFVFYTLTSLKFEGLQTDNLSVLMEILCNTSSLLSISLTNSEHITDSVVTLFAQRNPKLTSVDISATKVTDKAVHKITKHCAGLLRLNLNQCNLLTIRTVEMLAERTPGLLALDVAGYAKMNSAAALKCCDNLTNLTELFHSNAVDYGTIKKIGKICPNLSSLTIQHSIPPASCARLLEVSPHYTNITKLHIYCPLKLTSETMLILCNNSPNITDLLFDAYYPERVIETAVVVTNKLKYLKKCTFYTSKLEDYFHLNLFRAFIIISHRFGTISEVSLSKEFCLSGTPITDSDAINDSKLKFINNLNIPKSQSHDVLWSQISDKCTKMTDFTFLRSKQTWLPDACYMSNVTLLRLQCTTLLQLMTLTKGCENLREIVLHCDDIAPLLFASYFSSNQSLSRVTLSNCSRAVLTIFISAMSECHLKQLVFLKLDKCNSVMNKSTFAESISNLKFLHEIQFIECPFIDRAILTIILQQCKYLERLRVVNCSGVGESVIRWLIYLYNNNVQLICE